MQRLSPQLHDELSNAINTYQLERVANKVLSRSVECHAIVADSDAKHGRIGSTRFGGDPDLASREAWPSNDGKYSNFLVQINFAEFANLLTENGLPSSGILYLFVRQVDCAAAPVEVDAIFHEGDSLALKRRMPPEKHNLANENLACLSPTQVCAVPAVSVACYQREFISDIIRNTEEIEGDLGEDRLLRMCSNLGRRNQIGQLLGFANAADSECNLYRHIALDQLGKRDLVFCDYWTSMSEYEQAIEAWTHDRGIANYYRSMRAGVSWLMSNRETISREADKWRLLLRIESNRQMNLNFNDADPLYIFIRDRDLKDMNFTNLTARVTQG